MEIKLYHLANSRSQRIVWLLEELECEYELVFSDQADKSSLLPKFLPLKFPTIHIEAKNIISSMTETSAITEFLTIKHRKLIPRIYNDGDLINFLFWKQYPDTSLMESVILKQVFNQVVQKTPFPFKLVTKKINDTFNNAYLYDRIISQLDRINEHLRHNEYLCDGGFSLVDILIWFPLQTLRQFIERENFQFICEYMACLEKREAYQSALVKGKWNQQEFDKYWNNKKDL